MKILKSKLKRKEPNRVSKTALVDWPQQRELLGRWRDDGGLLRSSSGPYWKHHELPEQAGQQQSQRKRQQVRSEIVRGIRLRILSLSLDRMVVLFSQRGSGMFEVLPRLIHFGLGLVDLGSNRSDLLHARDEEEKTDSKSYDSQDNPCLFQGAPPFGVWFCRNTRGGDYRLFIIPIMLEDSILDHESQEAASAASWECLKNFSFLLLTESGISFCPENSVRFGRRAARSAPRSIDFSYVVRLLYQIRTYFQNK